VAKPAVAVPLRRRLMLVAVAGVLPVSIAAGLALWAVVEEQWHAAQAKSLEVTRLAAAAIEGEVERSFATLRGLAASPLVERDDLEQYEVLLRRVLQETHGWHAIFLVAPSGGPVIATGLMGDLLPMSHADSESFDQVVERRKPIVGYLKRGPDGAWGIPVRLPVVRDGELRYVLTAFLAPEAFLDILESQKLPADWVMSVFDSHGARIARSHDHDRTVGTPAAPTLQELMAGDGPHGMGVTQTLEGTQVYTAYVRIEASDWTVAIGIPTATVEAGAQRAFLLYGGGIVLSLLLALLWAAGAARGINGPIAGLRAAAARIGRGEVPAAPRAEIRELQELGEALVASAAERKRAELERREALAQLVVARDDLKVQVADLQRLQRLANEVMVVPDISAQLEAVLDALCELHAAPKGLVSLCAAGTLGVRAARGFAPRTLERLRVVRTGEGACGASVRDDCRVIVADTEQDPVFAPFRDVARAEGFRAVHSTPIRGSAGRVLGVLSVHATGPGAPSERHQRLADLCAHLCSVLVERAHAETVAAESERRLTVALDSSTVPFSVLAPVRDEAGVVVDFAWEYANRAAAAATHRDVGALAGRRIGELAPEVWRFPGVFEMLVSVVEHERVRELEVCATAGEAERCFQMVATPMSGKVAVWSADITERKQQERALQAADRRKDEFLAVLAHELRNPLAPIQQAALISSAPAASEAQKRWSHEVIGRQVKHMALLLEDLLDVSRITRGKLELRKSRIELRAAIDAAVETARPHLEAKGHRLLLDLPQGPVPLHADPLRVAQVATNLLTNAARYTGPGGVIRLAAGVRGAQAWLSVEDNGIGIPAEHLDSIFEMFSQGRAGNAAHGGGLGIGLALSRGIAHLHGGTLVAASAGPGQGSRFTLTLPLGEVRSDAAPRHAAAPSEPVAPRRILIADDNRDAAETLASVLQMSGHWTVLAYDGAGALAEYERHRPDVVILDIGMPGLSGYEVARRIRAMAQGAAPPVLVALTGWGQARDKATAAGAGFDHHMTKPVDMRALSAYLRPQSRTRPVRESAA
jgi:signal transduction histidine kinase/CheY-like chemotaxis protein